MITLKRQLAEGLDDPQQLQKALQAAIQLEHATLPPYLYALYSIEPGRNAESAGIIRSIALEEMLHFHLACNILIAIGGTPIIDVPGFVPTYPGPLPGSVESSLTVPLAPFSPALVGEVFMVIEEPEDPLEFRHLEAEAPHVTIGQFYTAIATQLKAAGPGVITGDPKRQVGKPDEQILNLDQALAAIHLIIDQGEGTTTSPMDEEGDLAHYYRFAEIFNGNRLVLTGAPPDAPPDEQYAYTGPEIPFDQAGVRKLPTNPSQTPYPAGSAAKAANDAFNYTYTSLLHALHTAFNGSPEVIPDAIGLMESCKQQALDMGKIPVGDDGTVAGPSFEYLAVLP